MSLVERGDVIKVLRGYNPWWVTDKVPAGAIPKLRRTSYWEAKKLLFRKDLKRAVVLSGPRRVGKTTILYQLIHSLLSDDVEPQNIVYITLDHPILKLISLDELLDLYDSDVSSAAEEKYIFLDELQYHEDPVGWLKVMVDKHPSWKFVVTGSASIVFRSKSRESGLGRIITVPVPTLSFYEYLALRRLNNKDFSEPVLPKGIIPTSIGRQSSNERLRLLSKLKPLRKEFEKFLMQGGFPETAQVDDLYLAQRILREDIVDKVLKRDMAAFYGIRKLSELERLFIYICLNNGGIVNIQNISDGLSIERDTVNDWLASFAGAHLLREIKQFAPTGKKYLQGKAKWYVVDASMRNAVLLRDQSVLLDSQEMGSAIVESAVINHLVSYTYDTLPSLGFWRNEKKKEVDLIIDVPSNKSVAVEVKYQEQVRLADNEGIFDYLAKKKDAMGIVVVKDAEDFETRSRLVDGNKVFVTLMPAYAFLYLLGRHEYERVAEETN